MRLSCQYSKTNFSTSALLSTGINDPVACIHPIFYANLEYLDKVYAAWEEGKLEDKKDQRLLFLALLNATNRVDWYCPADPKPETVAKHMEALHSHVMWMTDVMLPRLALPRFSINPSTAKLGNIQVWMEAWDEIRNDFEKGYLSRSEQAAKSRKEAVMELLTRTKNKDDTSRVKHLAYLRTLADWAAVALQFPASVSEFWKQIIRCQSARAALDFRPVDVEELLEHVTENGDYNSTHYFALLTQVKKVLADAKGESISDLDFASLLVDPDTPSKVRAPSSGTEAAALARQISMAPLSAPKESDFATKTQYLVAKARYSLAVSHSNKGAV